MLTRDLKAYLRVRDEWLGGGGNSAPIRYNLLMLQSLIGKFGSDFTIEGACKALDELARSAEKIKQDLQSAYND